MARASMSSMAMFPPTPTGTFYSGIRPNYGHPPPSVSHISRTCLCVCEDVSGMSYIAHVTSVR